MFSNKEYYDHFAPAYDRTRNNRYHDMLDSQLVELVHRYGNGRDIAEIGCGSGRLLRRFRSFSDAIGIDISPEMIKVAREKGLNVMVGNVCALPLPANSFDVACAFKVLPHVADIHLAMKELSRVTRVGGVVIAEFYNKRSIRYLNKKLLPRRSTSQAASEKDVYLRFDDQKSIASFLPETLNVVECFGARHFTPLAQLMELPLIGPTLELAEKSWTHPSLCSFLTLVARKNTP